MKWDKKQILINNLFFLIEFWNCTGFPEKNGPVPYPPELPLDLSQILVLIASSNPPYNPDYIRVFIPIPLHSMFYQ